MESIKILKGHGKAKDVSMSNFDLLSSKMFIECNMYKINFIDSFYYFKIIYNIKYMLLFKLYLNLVIMNNWKQKVHWSKSE